VYYYCQDQKTLQYDYNILYGSDDDFELCLEQGKVDSKKMLMQVQNSASNGVGHARKTV
jgi:hypothetical protein